MASCGICVCDAQRRVPAAEHERGAVHALCKAERCSRLSRESCSLPRGDTLANDAGTEARGSERGRNWVAVPRALARGWEERAAPIPKLAQARGDERIICVRVCVWRGHGCRERGCARSVLAIFSYSTHRHLEEIRSQSLPPSASRPGVRRANGAVAADARGAPRERGAGPRTARTPGLWPAPGTLAAPTHHRPPAADWPSPVLLPYPEF